MGNAKHTTSLISLLAVSLATVALVACGQAMEADMGTVGASSSGGGGGSQSNNCDPKLMTAFKSYHTALRQQCSACHVSGGAGAGAFADAKIATAFNVFKLKTETKIYSYAIDPSHKSPFSGPDNVALLEQPKTVWNAAMIVYNDCMSAGTNPGEPPAPPTGGSAVNTFTQSKTITVVAGAAPQTLTWQLGTEMETANPDLAGARLTAMVDGDVGMGPYIVISNIQVTGGTGASLYVKNVGIKLGGTLVPAPAGATFATAERYIPKSAARAVSKSGGAMVVPVVSLANLQIAIGFEKIEPSKLDGFPIDFDPPTHTQLVGTTAVPVKRVFSARCNSCHNATNKQGGVDLTNYNSLFGAGVKPFQPDQSLVYLSIQNGSMPPAGALPAAERDSVKFWIMDGAPR